VLRSAVLGSSRREVPGSWFGSCLEIRTQNPERKNYDGNCTSSSGSACSMFVSAAGTAAAGAGARRGALRRGAARFALRFAVFLALRFAGRFAAFFFDAFFVDLRDVAFFAILRRFLAMRAPPGKWARVF
jgi:hypothetical protein